MQKIRVETEVTRVVARQEGVAKERADSAESGSRVVNPTG
jgi:hypothetical protein